MSTADDTAKMWAEHLGVNLRRKESTTIGLSNGESAQAPLDSRTAAGVPTNMDRWRAENPDDIKWWPTANAGIVIQQRGTRTFFGVCKGCGASVQTVRDVSQRGRKGGSTYTGRWPDYCSACNQRLNDERNGVKARGYKRRSRAKDKELRDAQRAAQGLPPIRQGVPTGYDKKPVDYEPAALSDDVSPVDPMAAHLDDPPAGWPISKPWWPAGNPNRDASIDELEREILLARKSL